MFQRPELGRNQRPQLPNNRATEILFQFGQVISGLGFVVTGITGLESQFGDQNILDLIAERTGDVPVSLGALIIEWREQGFSDEMITVAILGISAFFLTTHVGFTVALRRLRRRP